MAAPAVAVLGSLAAAPHTLAADAPHPHHQASAATAAASAPVFRARLDTAVQPADHAARTYTVRGGNTLSGIAQQFYGHAGDWPWLARVNSSKISNPNLIYAGEVLSVPADPPASVRNGSYRPRHAKAIAARGDTAADGPGSSSGQPAQPSQPPVAAAASGSGTASCSRSGGGGPLPANYAAIVSFLTAHGYTGLAAAGVAGNIYQESEGNPESVGSGGGGLIGWTPLPGGFVTGDPAADLQTQLEALLSYNQQWAQYLPLLNAASSATDAAYVYMTYFERPGIPAAGNREAAAEAVAQACGL